MFSLEDDHINHRGPVRLRPGDRDASFLQEIKEVARTEFFHCLQCRACSNGCPFVEAMDLGPNKVMRLLQLNLYQEALQNSTIWICVGCHTCDSNCPMGIDIPAVMDFLREKALDEGVQIPEPNILNFHRAVLNSIAKYGRTHKLEIMFRYKIKSRKWFEDMDAGLRMLAKRKLDLLPSKIENIQEIRRIFSSNEEAT